MQVALILLLSALLLSVSGAQKQENVPALSCSLDGTSVLQERDPALVPMSYDVGDGPQTTWVYVEPDVATFYRNSPPPATTKVVPQHNGFSGKFINMSKEPTTLFWEEYKGGPRHPMRHHQPFSASGTATFPGHRFVFTPRDDPGTDLHTFIVGNYPENIYAYDPYYVPNDPEQTERNLQVMTPAERTHYDGWRKTIFFHEQYLNFTGRSYLANYLRAPPNHFMWRAEYFGQQHWVTTRETHFVEMPPADQLETIFEHGKKRIIPDDQPRLLAQYRDPTKTILNLTLTVLSVAPRVLAIENFLSDVEVQHMLDLAQAANLKLSTTGDYSSGDQKAEEDTRRTRTSFNSWIGRHRSPVVDALYRRSADLLRIDEALLRFRDADEYPELGTTSPISEDLQLVHYEDGQEYTAHHDFGFSRIEDEDQSARFATVLFYLNEGMTGGETSFPRWVNAETFKPLEVTPVKGKAVLFYSQLPDGNLDDFSHHAAEPVTEGEKWLTNLWVWAPTYE